MITQHSSLSEARVRFHAAPGPAVIRYGGPTTFYVADRPDELVNHPTAEVRVDEGRRTGVSRG